MEGAPDWEGMARLVRRARKGDEEAFRILLQSHRGAVTSTLLACGVRSRETAGDLAQEVAIKAWTRLAALDDPRSFTAWIRRIAANAARDHLRRQAARREETLEAATDLAGEEDPHRDRERVVEARLMLSALETEDREVVELLTARAEGVPMAQLAERMELSPDALKMRLMRARKRLRRRLEELRGEPPSP